MTIAKKQEMWDIWKIFRKNIFKVQKVQENIHDR